EEGQCSLITKKVGHCYLFASQVLPYCIAYKQALDGIGWDALLLALDAGATAACTAACFTIGAAQTACTAIGSGASVAELAGVAEMQSNTAAAAIEGIAAAAGGLSAGLSMVGTTGGAVREAGSTGGNMAEKSTDKIKDKAACASAVFFAITTGVRAWGISDIVGVKDSSCKHVKSLGSQMATLSGNTTSNITPNIATPGSDGGVGSGSGTGISGTGDSGPVTQQCGPDPSSLESCAQHAQPQGLAATDANLLNRSGLDKSLLPNLSGLSLKDAKGLDAGGAVSSALSGSGVDPSAVAAMAQLAAAAQEDGSKIAGAVPGAAYSGGGGGGGGGGSKGGGDNPLANLMDLLGGGGRGPAGGGPSLMTSFVSGTNADIFHSKTTMNLFEIVSERIAKASSRVGNR
ncbi:MAG: hypothetical protein ACXVBW_11835, partial [Bdellovibrionota bacterium]